MNAQRPALDADIAAALAAAQRPDESTDAAALQRVRSRLMRRIAQDVGSRHVTIAAGAGTWGPLLPGIERKVLNERDGVMSYLLKFAPGAVLPAHRHPLDEECIVLEGKLRIGGLVLGAGGYHLARQGLPHADITSEEGAVVYLHGASPRAEHLV
jgi:hypothetical protein